MKKLQSESKAEQKKYKQFLSEGASLFLKKQYQKAIAVFDKALLIKPRSSEALNLRGDALRELKQYEEALANYNLSLSFKPNNAHTWCLKAQVLHKLGRAEEAMTSLENVLRIQPDDYSPWMNTACRFFELQQYERAVICFNKALERQSQSIYYPGDALWSLRGFALSALNRNEEAIASYDRALEIGVKNDTALVWKMRGNACRNLGQYEEAIASYNQALQIKPDEDSLYGKGNALWGLGRYEAAIDPLQQCLQLNPDNHEALTDLGTALFFVGNSESAIANLNRAVELAPNYVLASQNRVLVLHKLGRHQEAINELERVSTIASGNTQLLITKASLLSEINRYEEAINNINQALNLEPNFILHWILKGIALEKSKFYQDSLDTLNYALQIEPNIPESWKNFVIQLDALGISQNEVLRFNKIENFMPILNSILWTEKGWVLENLERYEEALKSYNQSLEFRRDIYQTWKNRGELLLKLKRYEDAIVNFNEALKNNHKNADVLSGRGRTFRTLGLYQEALADYNQALDIDPNFHLAWHYRGQELARLELFEQAITDYGQAQKTASNCPGCWSEQGEIFQKLGDYEKAVICYEKALKIKSDNPQFWYIKGQALAYLNRHDEALAAFDYSLSLDSNQVFVWYDKGLSLQKLNFFAEALEAYNKALEIDNQYWQGWLQKGEILRTWKGYEDAISVWDEAFYRLNSNNPDHQTACGYLYYFKGFAHYQEGYKHADADEYWRKAVRDHQWALNSFSQPEQREYYLEVLQNLIKVYLALREEEEADKLLQEGLELRDRLLKSTPSVGKKKQLALKFSSFDRLTVDRLVQIKQFKKALEVAEKHKNARLALLLQGWHEESESPTYEDLRELVQNSSMAIVYWHFSVDALTTFVIKSNSPEPIPVAVETFDSQETLLNRVTKSQLLTNWIQTWDRNYQDYRQQKPEEQENRSHHSWRQILSAELEQLKAILNIPTIETELADVTQLILVPHRDLHRFPLHALFDQKFTVIYLPSLQMGRKLQQKPQNHAKPWRELPLLSVEDPAVANKNGKWQPLRFAEIESDVIRCLFQNVSYLAKEEATLENVKVALEQQNAVFHFTGHGEFNQHQPQNSALGLAGEHHLSAEVIQSLNLKSYELVSLAACETAVTGNQTLEVEYVGLSSAFLQAGVTYIISTLWTVNEISNAWFMIRFYQFLLGGSSPPSAFQQTQNWLRNLTHSSLVDWLQELIQIEGLNLGIRERLQQIMEDPSIIDATLPLDDPYHWAAFTLTGKVLL